MQNKRRGIRISVSSIGLVCLFGISATLLGTVSALASGASTPTAACAATDLNMYPGGIIDGTASDIRVRIFDRMNPREVELTNPSSGLLVFTGEVGSPALRLSPSEKLRLTIDGNHVRVHAQSGTVQARVLHVSSADGETVSIRNGKTSTPRHYYGELELRARADGKGFDVINRVPIEAYVAAVVGSEYGLKDLEGSKAMAVAARTYALHAMQNRSGTYDLVDNERAQVYRGAAAATVLARKATLATRGEILTYGGKPIDAVYSSSNGGHSADNESIWSSSPLPYLRGRKDPFDAVSPDAKWRFDINRDRLLSDLSSRYCLDVSDIELKRSSKEGRVQTVILKTRGGKTTNISGSQFRSTVSAIHGSKSLRSTFFSLRKTGNKYRFDGKGFGHGVGLSQWGAHGMANQGYGYKEILDFYYTDTQLDKGFERLGAKPEEIVLPILASDQNSTTSSPSSPAEAKNPDSRAESTTSDTTPKAAAVSGWGNKTDSDKDARGADKSASGKKTSRRGW